MRTALFASIVLTISMVLASACTPGSENLPPTAGAATKPGDVPATGSTAPANNAAETAVPQEPPTVDADPSPQPDATQTEPTSASAGQSEMPADSVSQLPDPAGFAWTPVVTGLTRPVDLVDLGDGTGRMLVLEQGGLIRVIQDGNVLPEPFLDLRDRVGIAGNERGLLGIALHPRFSENRFFYLNYTDMRGDTVIARYTAPQGDGNQGDRGTEKVLMQVDQPFANHNGGVLVFGPDGYLYLGLGDGGGADDPNSNGQNLETYLGKILRIDVDNGDPYAVPADNPFAGGGGMPEIWAYGLRNPWRISFDRLTGDLYIADVGQGALEEIDFQPAGSPGGENYGWDFREGTMAHGSPPAGVSMIDPVFEYSHRDGCSVTGGFVYRGEALAEFRGVYLLADYCSGMMWGLLRGADGAWLGDVLYQTGWNITSFAQDNSGELYLTEQSTGGVYRLARN